MSDDTTRITNRRDLLRASGAAGIALAAGCVSTTDDEGNGDGTETGGNGDADGETGPYRIGMVNSLTGSLSAFGERNQRGKDLALATVNEVGIEDRELDARGHWQSTGKFLY